MADDAVSGQYGMLLLDLGQWLVSYDPDGGDPDVAYPTGTFETSTDAAKAMRFDDPVAGWELWRTTSTRTPRRPDGKPNRPLAAHTITMAKLPTS